MTALTALLKSKNKRKTDPDALRIGRSAERSVQESIPILEWYDNNIIRIDETTYAVICSFDNMGYLSKTETEKIRKNHAYQEALASLPTYLHYQEIVANRPVNRQTYLDAVAQNPNPGADKYADAFFSVQEKMIANLDREISLKRYLLALSIEVGHNESPYNKLFDAVAMLNSKFREIGSELSVLAPDEVFAELYCWYNPFDGEMPKLPLDLYRRGLTVKDIIAPDGIEYKKNSLELGNAHCRVFSIVSYGKEIMDTIAYTLLNHNLPVAISKHIERMGKEDAIKNIHSQLNELESRRQKRLSNNKKNGTDYVPEEMKHSIDGCKKLLDELAGNEELLRQSVYVTVFAHSEEELEEYSERISSAALSVHCRLKSARFLQGDAFKSALPLGKDYVNRIENLLSSEAAVMTPFSYESQFDRGGFLYGRNEHSGEPIIANRKLGKSSHGFLFGVSGSGKGIFSKNELSNILYQPFTANDEVIAIDATGEFIPLAQAVNGKVIELEPSSDTHLNPLYISPAQLRILGKQQARASKIDHLIALLSQMKAGDGLNAIEKSLVDTVAARVLDDKKKKPTLDRFYEELANEAEHQPHLRTLIEEMRSWLKRYVEGSVTLFSGEDTEEQSDGTRFTVYSVRNLTGDLRDAGMIAMLERIESRVMENYAKGRWTWIYIEEMHRYFDSARNPYAAGRFARFYAELRHYGAILTGITQLPKQVVESKEGAYMLSNSRFVVMAELDGANIDAVTELYDLNEDQQRTLASADVGQYIMRMHNAPTSVRMVYPGRREEDKNLMYDLFNTSFEEGVSNATRVES